MFHDNDSQLVVNLDYQLDKKELDFMITKTLYIRCYSIKCDLSSYSLQHNILQYMIALKIFQHPKLTLNEQTNIIVYF